MRVVDFTDQHVERAISIAQDAYEATRRVYPLLPEARISRAHFLPLLNGLGAAMVDGQNLLGYLCAVGPFDRAFRSTGARGVFSPIHGNGVLAGELSADCYARLYAYAAQKWVEAGASSHAIALYAHEQAIQNRFFRQGFGLRCISAMRRAEPIGAARASRAAYGELHGRERERAYALEVMLLDHYAASPMLMRRRTPTEAEYAAALQKTGDRCFAATLDGQMIAFLKLGRGGEAFCCESPGVCLINGAFCLPSFRGQGIYAALLDFVLRAVKAEGFLWVNVDYESINPAADAFWGNFFTPYTHSVVRRVDEDVLSLL